MKSVAAVFFSFAVLTFTGNVHGEEMPHIAGETLADKPIDFPSACAGSICILVIGFSHASQGQIKAWTDRLHTGVQPSVAVYSIAVLEDAPRLVRGMAVHGIKSGVPEGKRDHFVIIYHGEPELKQITGFQKADAAYIVLLNRTGAISWTGSGPANDAVFSELKSRISSLERQ